MGIELIELEVRVAASVDVRGTLAIDRTVPVAFQAITCEIRMKVKDETPPKQVARLQIATQKCCIIQQTLRAPPLVKTTFIQ